MYGFPKLAVPVPVSVATKNPFEGLSARTTAEVTLPPIRTLTFDAIQRVARRVVTGRETLCDVIAEDRATPKLVIAVRC